MEIIKFSAVWCGPCKTYKTIFDSVVSEYDQSKLTVTEVDVEDGDLDLVRKYNVRSVPTTIFLKNDVVLENHVSIIGDDQLKTIIDKYINL